MNDGELVNQLGTGAIPAHIEQRLIARGVTFAAYDYPADLPAYLITSRHENVYKRWAEHMERIHNNAHGLPIRYRVPTP